MIDTFIRRYIETYTFFKSGSWCYEDGCFYKGVADLYEATRDIWFYDQLVGYINQQIHSNGKIRDYDPADYSLDNLNAGKVLFLLYEKSADVRYLVALRKLQEQLHTQPCTRAENFWHKKFYPFQVWLDGLYMALPLYAKYSLRFENGKSLADIRRQFFNVRSLLFDSKRGLYYHGYDESLKSPWADPETGVSPCFWSRAMGWYAMALVDVCDIIGEQHGDYIFYTRLLEELAENILVWQQPDGRWMQIMDQPRREGNYPETSASAMFAYMLLKGERLGILPARMGTAGGNAFKGLVVNSLRSDQESFDLQGICGMAGLGDGNGRFPYRDGSFEYYINEPVVANDPKGVGPFMMARAELIQLAGRRKINTNQPMKIEEEYEDTTTGQ